MQPPPRKGGYLKVCKNLQAEQISKLQLKNQQECDLLEDIRNFTKQRSSIEKSYGEALGKIAMQYQNRKIPCVPDIRLEDGSEAWNVFNVWRTVLDETEKLAKARLAAVDVLQTQISEDAKHTRQNKINYGKKLLDNLAVTQKEVQAQVTDLERCKKLYQDEEHFAHDAREKAAAAEEKLKRKKGSIFQSISSLQKNSAKFTAKREALNEKSAGARNEYLLALAATNAHQRRYYEIDFERTLRTMEQDMYNKVNEYLTLMSRTELLTCTATQISFNRIKDQGQAINRGYNLRCYLTFYPMLGQSINYDFEHVDGDRIDKISVHDESSQTILDGESKKCVIRIQKDVKTIRDASRKIQKIQERSEDPENDSKIDDLRLAIRKAETSKMKAEAKLEVLKEGGIEVEDYTQSVDSDSLGVDLDTSLSRSGSSHSIREEDTAPAEFESETTENDTAPSSNIPQVEEPTSFDDEPEETFEEVQAPEPANWDPMSVDWGDAPVSPLPPVSNGPEDTTTYPKCTALYNYTAQNPDELTIVENEELDLMGENDGDGWVKARNYKGEVGFIPQNYIEIEEGAVVPQAATEECTQENSQDYAQEYSQPDSGVHGGGFNQDGRGLSFSSVDYNMESRGSISPSNLYLTEVDGMEAPVSFSSIDYSFEGDEYQAEDDYTSAPPPDLPPPGPPTVTTNSGGPPVPMLNLPSVNKHPHGLAQYARALYDYEATCDEELTFEEGDILKILQKTVHDVDDGWWEGEINGDTGLFPSLVVEECRECGEPLTPDALSGHSPCTTPPPHTPPEVPGFLLPPERVIITQPTPEVEHAEDKESEDVEDEQKKQETTPNGNVFTYETAGFELELTGQKQQLYHQQFSSSSPESETTERDQQYAELVSSPDVSNQEPGNVDTEQHNSSEGPPSEPPPGPPPGPPPTGSSSQLPESPTEPNSGPPSEQPPGPPSEPPPGPPSKPPPGPPSEPPPGPPSEPPPGPPPAGPIVGSLPETEAPFGAPSQVSADNMKKTKPKVKFCIKNI